MKASWTQLLKKQKKEPIIWVMDNDHTGDMNNGLAVALAISPNNTRIASTLGFANPRDDKIWATLRKPGPDGKKTFGYFHKPGSNMPKDERTLPNEELPDIIIDSTNGNAYRDIKRQNTVPWFKDTLSVHIAQTDTCNLRFIPETDLNIAFTHQMEARDGELHNAHTYDLVPTRVNKRSLEEGAKAWGSEFSTFRENRPMYFVVLGERTDENYELSLKEAKALADKVTAAAKKTGGSVVLTTSPRVRHPKEIIEAFTDKLTDAGVMSYCYDFAQNKGKDNPYMGLLALADRIVITNDSISMQSDAVATGKPVYLCNREKSDKPLPEGVTLGYNLYSKVLTEKGYVLPLDQLAEPAPRIPHAPDTTAAIVNDIHALLKKRQRERAADKWIDRMAEFGQNFYPPM